MGLHHGQEIHVNGCKREVGPRGGVTLHTEVWRVNGMVKTWKTRPAEFQIPLKYGFRGPHIYLDQSNVDKFHLPGECPTIPETFQTPEPRCDSTNGVHKCWLMLNHTGKHENSGNTIEWT